MNAKQFAWTYLINNGRAGVRPSYYGGVKLTDSGERVFIDTDDVHNSWLYDKDISKIRDHHISEIHKIGVDWNKTVAPESDKLSSFNGTFAPSSMDEYLMGTLILSDGSTQEWYSDPVPMTNVFEALGMKDEYEEKFNKLFISMI